MIRLSQSTPMTRSGPSAPRQMQSWLLRPNGSFAPNVAATAFDPLRTLRPQLS
jgi:hypothetical protein